MRLRRLINRFFFLVFFLAQMAVSAEAAASQPPKTLVNENATKSFAFIPEFKLTSVYDQSAAFAGARMGLLLDNKFMIGVGGYGMVTPAYLPVGYGGIALEFLPWSDRLTHVSFGGLVGGGGYLGSSFFVAEPEVRLNVSATKWLRLGVGGGYRFIGGGGCLGSELRGPQLTFSLGFKVF